jgi:hypothetical protein
VAYKAISGGGRQETAVRLEEAQRPLASFHSDRKHILFLHYDDNETRKELKHHRESEKR